MKEEDKKQFARQFSLDDWNWLNTSERFSEALNNGTLKQAKSIAWELIIERNGQL